MALCAYRLQWVRLSTSTIVRVPAATRAAKCPLVYFAHSLLRVKCIDHKRSPVVLLNQGERKINGRAQPNLAHPVNHAFGSLRHWLVPFRQEFGQNRKVLHWIVRTFRVGLNIDNVGRRMPGKILLQNGPGARHDPAASIETGDRSAENITREWKGCDVTAGRTSVSV